MTFDPTKPPYQMSPHIRHRNDFPKLLNSLGLLGIAVEVGTHEGEYAETLRREWSGMQLLCVDPWSGPRGYEMKGGPVHPCRIADYVLARKRLNKYGDLVQIIRATAEDACLLGALPSYDIDFVYLDGDHETAAVAMELDAFWPRLRAGGILAGHDIHLPPAPDARCAITVRPAVEAFARKINKPVFLVRDPDSWSFYFMKDKEPKT